VRPGQQHAATHSRDNLWRVWESLPRAERPWLVCGDASFGNGSLMSDWERRGQQYLFRLRRSVGVQRITRTSWWASLAPTRNGPTRRMCMTLCRTNGAGAGGGERAAHDAAADEHARRGRAGAAVGTGLGPR